MSPAMLKKTVKNETIHPFALTSENPWRALKYRYDPAEAWNNALETTFLVLPGNREDVRTDVLHAFEIHVDSTALEDDGIPTSSVELLVLTRDPFAKQIVEFHRQPVSDGPVLIDVPRASLESTSLKSRIDFHVMLVATAAIQSERRRFRRGARLAVRSIGVSAERKGITFNFTKAAESDFVQRGLPSTTTFHLEVPRPEELVGPCDDVAASLTVLVHEDAWATLQEIRTGDRVGEALGNMFPADVLFGFLLTAGAALKDRNTSVDDDSVLKRVLGWLSSKGGETIPQLEQRLRDGEGILTMHAQVQSALKLTNALLRVPLAEETEE
jgi:hypothetical protein